MEKIARPSASCARALFLSEIIRHILGLTRSQKTLATAAVVCRTWSDVALDLLWKDANLLHLLQLLGFLAFDVNGLLVSGINNVRQLERLTFRSNFSDSSTTFGPHNGTAFISTLLA